MIRVPKIDSLKVDQSATHGLKSRQVLTDVVRPSDEAAVALTNGSSWLAGPGDRPLDRKGGAGWPVPAVPRSLVICAHDLSAALASLGLALLLRQNGQAIWADLRLLADAAPLFLALAGASFLAFGLHRRIWSYTSVGELAAIVKASTWAVVLFLAVGWAAGRTTAVPPALWVIQWLILVVLLCGTRLAYRFAKTRVRRARAGAARAPTTRDVPVLLYGCGPMAALFVGAVQSAPGSRLRVVGIIEDAGTPRGRYVHNVPVLGEPRELDRIVADLAVQGIHPQRLVITRPADGLPPELRTFAEHCGARHGMELHVLPEMLAGRLRRRAKAARATAAAWPAVSTASRAPYARRRRSPARS